MKVKIIHSIKGAIFLLALNMYWEFHVSSPLRKT